MPRSSREWIVVALWATALLGSSAGAVALFALRVARTGEFYLGFLLINLALAWLPLLFACVIALFARAGRAWLLLPPTALWLLFLPNSPYIWTDFLHLAGHPRPYFVTDFLVIAAFAVAGLLAGYSSLFLVHISFRKAFGRRAGWLVVSGALPLTSLGVYIGRVLRWNSWNAFGRLDDLADLVVMRLEHPLGNPSLFAACLAMTLCLAAGYLVVYALTRAALIYGVTQDQIASTASTAVNPSNHFP